MQGINQENSKSSSAYMHMKFVTSTLLKEVMTNRKHERKKSISDAKH